jgi:hypothetical protein
VADFSACRRDPIERSCRQASRPSAAPTTEITEIAQKLRKDAGFK